MGISGGCITHSSHPIDINIIRRSDPLKGALEWVRNPAGVEELIAYLEKRQAYIPNYQQRKQAGLWIASTRVEKYNDWEVSGRCKHQGMSWSPQGVLALAALEAARLNGELDDWRRDRVLPESGVARTDSAGRLIAEPAHQLASARGILTGPMAHRNSQLRGEHSDLVGLGGVFENCLNLISDN